MDKMEDFFQMEHNLHRKGGHLHPETWRKVRMHILSESICMPMCLTLVRWHSVQSEGVYIYIYIYIWVVTMASHLDHPSVFAVCGQSR